MAVQVKSPQFQKYYREYLKKGMKKKILKIKT